MANPEIQPGAYASMERCAKHWEAKAAIVAGVDLVLPLAKRYASQSWVGDADPLKALCLRMQRHRERSRMGQGFAGEMRGKDMYSYAVSAIRAAIENRPLEKCLQTSVDFPMPADWKE